MSNNKPVSIELLRANAAKASGLLKAIANENRLLILCHLGMAEMSVSELNQKVDLSQSSLSQHLARLRADDLVQTRREAQTIYYSIANPVVGKLIEVLQQEYCR